MIDACSITIHLVSKTKRPGTRANKESVKLAVRNLVQIEKIGGDATKQCSHLLIFDMPWLSSSIIIKPKDSSKRSSSESTEDCARAIGTKDKSLKVKKTLAEGVKIEKNKIKKARNEVIIFVAIFLNIAFI